MIEIAVCDDDKAFLKEIDTILKKQNPFGGKYNLTFFQSGMALLKNTKIRFDLIFLDIQMPKLDGIKTAKFLREQGNNAVLVFLTAVSIPSTETFKVAPFRYLVKPLTQANLSEDLPEIFDEVIRRYQTLLIKCGERLHEIKISAILYLTINHKSVDIVTDSGRFTTKETMRELEQKLSPFGFVHSHKSYLINLNRVSALERLSVTMESGEELPISQPKAVSFRKSFIEYAERKVGILK